MGKFLSSLKTFVKSVYEPNLQIYRENGFHYTAPIPYNKIGKPFKFYGYFQEKEQDIFKFIKLIEQRENIKLKHATICDFNNTISVHFRY